MEDWKAGMLQPSIPRLYVVAAAADNAGPDG